MRARLPIIVDSDGGGNGKRPGFRWLLILGPLAGVLLALPLALAGYWMWTKTHATTDGADGPERVTKADAPPEDSKANLTPAPKPQPFQNPPAPANVPPFPPPAPPPPPPAPPAAAEPEKGKPFTNSVGMKFVWIEPGSFLMGSTDATTYGGLPGQIGWDKEPPHRVTLTKGFHMGVYLVTQEQWERVMGKGANHSTFMGKTDDEKRNLPVDDVSWDDCQEFCRKLSALEGRTYTLPTEAQWEYACRAGTSTPFWWGAKISVEQANFNGMFTQGKDGKQEEYRQKTTPVDFFKPNPWGLYDVHGNLEQWCADYYDPEYYAKSPNKDPENTFKSDGHVLRGGSWGGSPWGCRSASRFGRGPSNRFDYVGCRVALYLDGPPVANTPEPPKPVPPPAPPAAAEPQKGKPFTNSIGMKFVWIEPGTFLMGSPDVKTPSGITLDSADVKRLHKVTLTKGFHMGEFLVTKGQFAAFVKDAGYQTDGEKHGDTTTWRVPSFVGGFKQTDDDPVVEVTWNDAVQFCEWLSTKEQRTYRLPTEAQWEYACRAGTTTAYSFGDDPKDLGDYAWYDDNSFGHTHPVGGKKPNPWGLYDMQGDVWQWCQDDCGPYPDKDVTDPINTGNGSDFGRVMRGGAWYNDPWFCRASERRRDNPAGSRGSGVGFRVCLCQDDAPKVVAPGR